jgi:hypothetical protein
MEAPEARTMWVALDWVEAHCIVPDGFRRGAPFRLYHYQGRYLANFYLIRGDARWIPDNPLLGSAFVYRRGLLIAPQKAGKNPLIATQVCLEGVGPSVFAGFAGKDEGYVCADHGCHCGWERRYEPGEPMGMPRPTPLIQITGFSEDSTGNTYDALRPMIDLGPLHDLIPHTGEDFIRLPDLYGLGFDLDTACRIDTVTSSAQSRLGQRATFIPQDQLELWTASNKMTKLADTQYRNLAGMDGRASLTANAYDPAQHSIAQREFTSPDTDVYRQFIQPPANLSYGDKRERHKIHRIVYEPDTLRENGGHVTLDSIEAEAASMAEHDPAQAARFFGNILTAGSGAAVDAESYDRLVRLPPFPPILVEGFTIFAPPEGIRIGAGFDGSISEDSTVLRGCTADGYRFVIGQWDRPIGDEMTRWRDAHPGRNWSVPRREVNERVAWMFGYFDVGRFMYDPPKWRTEGETWQATYGDEIVIEFPTYISHRFAPAVDRWLTDLNEGSYSHDGNGAHIKAAALRKVRGTDDPNDNRTYYVLVKGDDRDKIDGAIADVLASEAAATMPEKLEDDLVSIWDREPDRSIFLRPPDTDEAGSVGEPEPTAEPITEPELARNRSKSLSLSQSGGRR